MKWRFDSQILTDTDSRFRSQIDQWILIALEERPVSWQGLLQLLPGVFPLDVWAGLERIGYDFESLKLEAPDNNRRDSYQAEFVDLLEHPLDYEWRFADSGIDSMLEAAKGVLLDSPAEASCLGCPTIFTEGAKRFPNCHWHLVDRRAERIKNHSENASSISWDLRKPLEPKNRFGIAFVDPPWYNPITLCFLQNAVRQLKTDGTVLLSMPAIGTRPSAEDDRVQVLKWCAQVGLVLESVEDRALLYSTPYFEQKSLIAAGFTADVPTWRRGDLLRFRLSEISQKFPEAFTDQQAPHLAKEFRFGDIKIITLESQGLSSSPKEGGFKLSEVWNEETLPSVSTRFARRNTANIVTSGNRFFHCDNISAASAHLTELLDVWEDGCWQSSGTNNLQLKTIINNEVAELKVFKEVPCVG